jgi:AraC family transcriptional regulator
MHPGNLETRTKECNCTSTQNPGRQELSKLQFSGLTLTETLHASGSRIPPHIHDAATICVALAGQAVEIVEGIRVPTKPGCVIMRGPNLMHSDEYGAVPQRAFMIELEEKWFQSCRHIFRLFEGHRHFANDPVSALALRVYRESRVRDNVAPVIVEGLMLEMLGHASRSLIKTPVGPPVWLTQARDLLHGRFNDSLNLMEIAHTVGVHPTHLARTFKRHYRTTVGEYLRQLRLDWATRQLSETEDSIAEIASAAGFYDQSHFSHLFKQHTGFTPAEFRSFSNGAA